MVRLMILIGLACGGGMVAAAPAEVSTPAPVIYLEDNLDEIKNLGYCLDTVGRGLSDRMHAHSCKPQGGDVQFIYDEDAKRIASHAFPGLCMEIGADGDFGLLECSETPAQTVVFDSETGLLHPGAIEELCIGTGPDSRQAGPFQSRDLVVSPCSELEDELKTWVVVAE